VTDLVFFYGTLMTALGRPARRRADPFLEPVGRGTIAARLFDLGLYPAAVPAHDTRVVGEVCRMTDTATAARVLDEVEGYEPANPALSLFVRAPVPVRLEDGRVESAWVYFYRAPLGRARPIASGDYLRYLEVRETLDVHTKFDVR
jgi:gamma-glutamylcyclotransferase (GGCT)/AIG2-like uncharacterized protein YtfP